jgi:SAM-dependent methyltransferase
MTDIICRSCDSKAIEPILSLGCMPLANAYVAPCDLDKPEPRYPLELAFCHSCGLVQILETVPPERLFREYPYFSSFSDTLLQHARALAQRIIAERRLTDHSMVVELASNDGYLLRNFVQRGIPVCGIEPARNIANVAEEAGIPTLAEFFTADLAHRLARDGVRADVIVANNVLAHAADLNGFVGGIRALLKDDGVAVIEVPYVKDMIEKCEFDTIYHEHLCYYSVTSLAKLFGRHDLTIRDVERIPIHGGSLRLFVGASRGSGVTPRAAALQSEEARWGAASPEFYYGFASRVAAVKAALVALLETLRRSGQRIAAYGAAAKGTVLLNYCGIGTELLEFVVDRSPVKQGRYMPGVHVPIVSPEKIMAARPEYLLLLAWNLAGEIVSQERAYQEKGGRFIIPIPEPRVI